MSLPDLLSPEHVRRMAQCLSNIEGIDRAIGHLFQKTNDPNTTLPDEIGDAVRQLLGRNHMPHFTDERLGLVVQAAVMNALLYERELMAREVDGFVLVNGPACESFTLGDIWARFEKGEIVDVYV